MADASQGFATQAAGSDGGGGATDTTIPVTFVIPEELNANGPILRFRVIVRAFGSSVEELDTWYNSFHHPDRTSAPPYQAVEMVIEENVRRKRDLRQAQVKTT